MAKNKRDRGSTLAYAWADGSIGFATDKLPSGALPIARADAAKLRSAIAGNARLAYDNATYLVPGVPEATDRSAAYDALRAFNERIADVLMRQYEVTK